MKGLALALVAALALLGCGHLKPTFKVVPGETISVGLESGIGVSGEVGLSCYSSVYQKAVDILDKVKLGGLVRLATGCD